VVTPTPRPWKFNGGSKVTGWHDGREITVATVSLSSLSSAEMDANARLIVRAVNSHDELLAAAESGLAFMRHALEFFGWAQFPSLEAEVEQKAAVVGAAIAKAKAGAA
jgi:hypothetical protein